MLSAILKKVRLLGARKVPNVHAGRPVGSDLAELPKLIESFPIGKKLRYCPEYHYDITLDTLIVAYCVNNEYVYSRDAIRTDHEGTPTAIAVGKEKMILPVAQIRQFHLLVPDTSDLEGTLDYERRATIGPGGQFRKNNTITLIANSGARGVSSVDTRVVRLFDIEEGPYATSRMVLLEPDIHSLSVTDQRQELRVAADIPVEFYVKEGKAPCAGSLLDFSGTSVRLRLRVSEESTPTLKPNDPVTIVINLADASKTYRIAGKVFRHKAGVCVVRLEKLYKDGEFTKLSRMDRLELKAAVLNYTG
jgi:hypothetical protein